MADKIAELNDHIDFIIPVAPTTNNSEYLFIKVIKILLQSFTHQK